MAPPKKNRAQLPVNHTSQITAKDGLGWALKKGDGEMFTRADIQYDLMSDIFNDQTFKFTSPFDQRPVTFKELYVETLSKFSKAAKSTVRQLDENPNWATNFCIASFLINIGRINTTVAFYPELRAYMRTYHPIPCLQKDEYCKTNLQDAPRIKTMLKSCQLPYELNNEPGSLPEIANRSAQGYRPPTTVVNLIFELFNVEPYVSAKYFPEGFVLHDLFSPTTIPTKLRAYAFLWLMHHFLEDPSSVTDFEEETKIQAFQLARLEDIQPSSMIGHTNENIDLEEELQWGRDMQAYRLEFLKKWRGEEGIGFIDDLPTESIVALGEDAHLTKKQKMMVQNYAQAIEADDNQQASSSNVPTSQLASNSHLASVTPTPRNAQINGGTKEGVHHIKPKTVTKTKLTHVERLQGALDAIAKYGDDSDLNSPEDTLTPVKLAWRRNQYDLEQDRDVAYDSDDPAIPVFPEWKPKELKSRLLGFAFPIQPVEGINEEERKDKVIRYVGTKKTSNKSLVDGNIKPQAGSNSLNSPSSATKIKRKRKVTSSTKVEHVDRNFGNEPNQTLNSNEYWT